MKKTQASGRNLEAAINNALEKLQLTRDQVEVTVLQEGGFLKQFKVEVTEIVPEVIAGEVKEEEQQVQATETQIAEEIQPQQTSEEQPQLGEDAISVKEFLQTVLTKMGFDCTVTASMQDGGILLNIGGKDTSSAIGYRGEVLDALQYLCSLELGGKENKHKRVTLDAEGYRAKREKALQKLANNLEQKVKRTGKAVNLEPMNPYERRIIHTALQNSKYVSTESEGQGNTRHVVISPKGQSDILNAPNAPRKTLNFVYRSEKKRRK